MSFNEVIGVISNINECVNFFQWATSTISSLRSKWTTVQKKTNHEEALHLQSDLQRLRESLAAMYNLIDQAEWKSHILDIAKLLPWLKDAVYDADDFLDEFRWHELKLEVEGNGSDSSFLELFDKVIHGNYNRVKEIQKRLDNLSGMFEMMGLLGAPQRFDKSVRPETSSLPNEAKIFGRQKELKEVMELLGVSASRGMAGFKRKRGNNQATCRPDDIEASLENFSVLPIVGIGGVGKTTLSQHISNHPRVKSHFKLIIWTCVSDDFDVKRLTKELIQSISGKDITSVNLDYLQHTLKKNVDKKKVLLILDDMWDDVLKENEQRWKNFCAPFADIGHGSMILVTTRSAEVAGLLGTMEPFPLEGLKDGVFWDLFKLCAFGSQNCNNFPELEHIGKSIATKLKGSPLAAKTLGRLLRRNLHTIHWNNILKSELWELKQEETDILPALRLSYMYLPPHLKKCFSFCAVYPKDHIFEKEKIARIWAAEGFVDTQGDIPIEDLSCQYFEDLTNRSFFQALPSSVHNKYVIHDLMHDMAQLVSKDECFIIRDLTDLKKVPPNVRHLSIFTNSIVDCSNFLSLCECKKLRTLVCNDLFKNKDFALVVDKWFSGLQHIRVFSCSYIKKLPDSVGNLKHLRYLGISKACHFKTLPLQFFFLYNLQFLIAERCQFESLPSNSSKLISLQRIESKTLRFLPGGNAAAWGQGIRLLKNINSAHGRFILGRLGKLQNKDDATKVELHSKNLDTVSLQWRSTLDKEVVNGNEVEVLEALCPPSNIKSLELWYYPGRSMASWFQPHKLQNLTSIDIWECDGMEEIFSLAGNSVNCARPFSYLTVLNIHNCKKLSSLERFLQPIYMPAMKKIKVQHCRNLASIPAKSFEDFYFLEELVICYCPIASSEETLRLPPSLKMLKLEKSGELSYAVEGLSITCFSYSCSYVEVIPIQIWASKLPALDKLEIKSCESLESIEQSEAFSFHLHGSSGSDIPITFSALTDLSISYCEKLTSLDGFLVPEYLPAIKIIRVSGCNELLTLPGEKLHGFLQLEVLSIDYCPCLNWQRGLVQFPSSLQKLCLIDCGDLSMWVPSCLQNLTSLVSLTLIKCSFIESIPSHIWSSNIKTLQELHIWDCPDLVSIGGPKTMKQITDVCIEDCRKLEQPRQPFRRGKFRKRNWCFANSTK
ncbi:unnamed protein product [Urochloa decumbens]|uniref:Uncharacterized protein n=1 Tax=Urochloa decumbens TaxID=240449 RepID=A0ABC9A023_9POAL